MSELQLYNTTMPSTIGFHLHIVLYTDRITIRIDLDHVTTDTITTKADHDQRSRDQQH